LEGMGGISTAATNFKGSDVFMFFLSI